MARAAPAVVNIFSSKATTEQRSISFGDPYGVGFAIPIDLANDVMRQLVARGRVMRGWIGVVGRGLTPQLAESFGLRAPLGVLVTATLEYRPAEREGLRPGDVLTRVDGRAVTSTHEVLEAIASAGPGALITLEVWRGSERRETRAVTRERPLVAKP